MHILLGGKKFKMKDEINLTISAINVNSFNVSKLVGDSNKTFVKIEGITAKKCDIILIVDTRMGLKVKELEKMMQITKQLFDLFNKPIINN